MPNGVLRVDGVDFAGDERWWSDAARVDRVMDALRGAGLGAGLDGYRATGGKWKALGPDTSLGEELRGGKGGIVEVGPEGGEPPLTLWMWPGRLWLALDLPAAGPEVVDGCVRAARALAEAFGGRVGPTIALEAHGVSYPRPRPPRDDAMWKPGAALLVVLHAFAAAHPERAAQVEKVRTAELPPGARREDDDVLLALRWAESLDDEAALKRQLSLAERWMGDLLDLPVEGTFNAAGDAQHLVLAPEAREPLTSFDAVSNAGYKAVVRDPDGGYDEEVLAEMEALAKAGALPDGSPLAGVSLIAPDRETALDLAPRVRERAIAKVLYPDDEGVLWDPFPPGEWMDDSET